MAMMGGGRWRRMRHRHTAGTTTKRASLILDREDGTVSWHKKHVRVGSLLDPQH
jgi:hypothetical protein